MAATSATTSASAPAGAQDPFYVVKEEIEKVVAGVEALHAQWRKLLEEAPGSEDFSSTGATAVQRIKDVEWDVQDLAETVVTVERNRARFRVDDAELAARKAFVARTRDTLQRIRAEIESPESKARASANARSLLLRKREGGAQSSRYARLDEMIAQENGRFVDGQEQMQAQLIRQQDADLDALGSSVRKLGDMGRAIGDELDVQNRMLDDLGDDVDRTTTRFDAAKRKIERIIASSRDRCMTILVVVLILVLVGVVLTAILYKKKTQ